MTDEKLQQMLERFPGPVASRIPETREELEAMFLRGINSGLPIPAETVFDEMQATIEMRLSRTNASPNTSCSIVSQKRPS